MTARRSAEDCLAHIVQPVFEAAARRRLRADLPLQPEGRADFAAAEAFCRSFLGAAPWLGLDGADGRRDSLRAAVVEGLAGLTDPCSPDFAQAEAGPQMLVEAAFLSTALLRSGDAFWVALPSATREGVLGFLRATRRIEPAFSNWLLFPAAVEAFLCRAGEEWDAMRVDYAVRQHEQWYVGDGAYGDGPHFRWDYYNSFVIHPLLHEIMTAHPDLTRRYDHAVEATSARLSRYAVVLEAMISPEGTFPAIGRSMTYRTGSFHALAYAAWKGLLPPSLPPAAVRGALDAVTKRVFSAPDTFDSRGWLRAGLAGFQPGLAEHYISTGSLYLCTCGFLALGLPADAAFWADPDLEWSSRRIWGGGDSCADHALKPEVRWMT